MEPAYYNPKAVPLILGNPDVDFGVGDVMMESESQKSSLSQSLIRILVYWGRIILGIPRFWKLPDNPTHRSSHLIFHLMLHY